MQLQVDGVTSTSNLFELRLDPSIIFTHGELDHQRVMHSTLFSRVTRHDRSELRKDHIAWPVVLKKGVRIGRR